MEPYETPQSEVILLDTTDVIITSSPDVQLPPAP